MENAMRTTIRMFLCALLASMGGISVGSTAHAAEVDTTLDAVQTLSAQVYALSRDTDRAILAVTPAPASLDARLRELRQRIEALARTRQAGSADTTPFARKLHSLSLLLGNAERARALNSNGSLRSLVPVQRPSSARNTFMQGDARRGGRCKGALGLGAGSELDGVLDAAAEVWLHVNVASGHAVKVDTSVTALDTEIAVFDACPTHGEAPVAASDDSFGLAAAVVLHSAGRDRTYWLRIRNLGRRGDLGVVADSTGTVSGTISWDYTPPNPSSPRAIALDHEGFFVGADYAVAGGYGLGLAPGDYYVLAEVEGNVPQIWPNIECGSSSYGDCTHPPAQLLTVTASSATTGIDFSLNKGAHIGGRVRDAANGLAIPNAYIEVMSDALGTYVTTSSDAAGRFVVTGLAAGQYRVRATSTRYLQQMFNGVDCPVGQSCAPDAGNVISLARQGAFDQANFGLHPASFVQAVVHAAASLPFNSAYVTAYDSTGNWAGSTFADIDRPVELGPFAPGSYRFSASMQYYASQLYDHIDCASDCVSEQPTATVLPLVAGAPEPSISFDLHKLPVVSGRVTDSGTGSGLWNVSLILWPTLGSGYVGNTATQADGTYSIQGVVPGTYWLVASSTDHADRAYVNAPCDDGSGGQISGCQLTSAQAITIGAADVPGIDLALPLNGTIAGQVDYAGPGTPTPAGWSVVHLYNASGNEVRYVNTDASGAYSISDLPPGSYFAQANGGGSFGQIYAGIDCPIVGSTCDPTIGTPIALAQGEQRGDIDFNPVDTHRILGRVTDSQSGQGVAGVVVDAWDPQNGQHCDDAATDLQGYYAVIDTGTCPSPLATRVLSTDAGPAHIDQVFAGIACPHGSAYAGACSLSGATPVPFPTTPTPTQADFVLDPRDPDLIFRDGFDAPVLRPVRALR
jgi:protocatechuate 3,4-dioxygenase beta subunit